MDNFTMSPNDFFEFIKQMEAISTQLFDGWVLKEQENGVFLTKKSTKNLNDLEVVTFEYHIVYSLAYAVPMLCFNVWRSDGTFLTMEEFCNSNPLLKDCNIFETLTQLDHPVLCRPFLTLHPCRTQEILESFSSNSKNPVISWLSVVAPFANLDLLEDYFQRI